MDYDPIHAVMRNAGRIFVHLPKAITLAFLIALLSVFSSCNELAASVDLSQFQWKKRLLFLFAPNRKHPSFDSLHSELAARKAEAADRHLVIFEILEAGQSSMNTVSLDPQTTQALQRQFDVTPGKFTVILVGKDGGTKLIRQGKTQLEDIFALIDAMPMRQEELRQKSESR